MKKTRNVTLTLEQAKEWYKKGGDLKEVALQAFTEKELKSFDYTDIKTFEDACEALGLDIEDVKDDLVDIECLNCGALKDHLTAIYKLDIIHKALNRDWEPSMTKGDVYYSWVRFYEPKKKPLNEEAIATFIADNKKYHLVGGFGGSGSSGGLGYFYSGVGCGASDAYLGLLGCKSKEIAQYMSKTFGALIFDAIYSQHIGAYKWV